jgi:5-methylcytosine-specific restriction endonuclease McrA
MKIENIVICCGSCNSSRWTKELKDRFKTDYCKEYNINEITVATSVEKYLETLNQ